MDKQEILLSAQKIISEKIQQLHHLIVETRQSNGETKSAMGDKYETGAEMLQQEINHLNHQLSENMKLQNSLQRLNNKASITADLGALVETNNGIFYISAAAGTLNFQGRKIMCVSPESPIAKVMNGLVTGQTFTLNGTPQTIMEIW